MLAFSDASRKNQDSPNRQTDAPAIKTINRVADRVEAPVCLGVASPSLSFKLFSGTLKILMAAVLKNDG